jgi:hypothetical protein
VKDSAHAAIHDPVIGRPIWREIREAVFNTPNQVGGDLGDYMVQQTIDDGTALKVIDGFGGSVGYDLDNLDAVLERTYPRKGI